MKRKIHPLLYIVKNKKYSGPQKVLRSQPAIFYIIAAAVIFLCAGILLNAGFKIYDRHYIKQISSINEMLLIEKERSRRIQLKISELKGPERIMFLSETALEMDISENFRILYIDRKNINTYPAENPVAPENFSTASDNYDNLFATIYSIRDIVMVVSEGVLTFFIP